MARGARILLCDPDPQARRDMAEVARSLAPEIEVEILEAPDWTHAERHLQVEPLDLIVTEALLDGGNGFALLRQSQAPAGRRPDRARPVPVIMVTALGREIDRYWALRNGAHAFLTKPFDREHLGLRIRKALAGAPRATPERS